MDQVIPDHRAVQPAFEMVGKMTLNQDILIRNGFVAVPAEPTLNDANVGVATIVSNLASYGYTLDRAAFSALMGMENVGEWWTATEKVLKSITGGDRNMGDYIVYKNFPREVLDMDMTTSVFRQILIYLGIPYDLVREEELPRQPLGDMQKLKVLTLADDTTADKIFANLMVTPNRWSDNQIVWAERLLGNRNCVVLSDFVFKENGINLAAKNFDSMEFEASSSTDVLRLCAVLSNADVSLRQKIKLRTFKRAERRRLLAALDQQANLASDMATRPELWKRLMERLRPGDYDYANVKAAYDGLYHKRVKSFAALVDPQMPSLATLDTAATRPGEFLRRFHHYYSLFGIQAVDRFLPVMEKLKTRQLLGLRGYLRTINARTMMIYPPKSNWSKAKVMAKTKTPIAPEHRRTLDVRISQILSARLQQAFPEGLAVDLRVDQIKFQTNDQKLAEYGRGTEFDIPANIKFLRSASYWTSEKRSHVTWYDNGWNFFDDTWKPLGTCGWNAQQFPLDYWRDRVHPKDKAAIFSGDPVNIRDLKGRACQMIDLYLDQLEKRGVRFAVWSILCYSKVKFSEAGEVLATLQMGEDAETGAVYEPSRAQMVFPLKSETYTSYVAYIDIKRRKLVYMDVAFPGSVMNAEANSRRLEELMPAYVEYLDALPTVLELVQDAKAGAMPVLFDDANIEIKEGKAFVFRPENRGNSFNRVSVADLLSV